MATSVKPVFSFNLNSKIIDGKVTIGKYDGTHSCLTAATSADKIIIHSPHRRSVISNSRVTWSEVNQDIASLTLSQPVTTIYASQLIPNDEREILIIGSPTHLLAYHVDNNADVFYKEIKEGVQAIVVGLFGTINIPLVLVGGNGCIRGFNHEGNELFWLVTSGNIISLALIDMNKDEKNELIVGCDDVNIKIYRGDELMHELIETGSIQYLVNLGTNHLAYTVDNGTIGVYEENVRLWRIKSKHRPTAMISYDLLGMGTQQLITGWDSGKIDVRDSLCGDVLMKISLSNSVSGLLKADYRGIGKSDLICCGQDGEIRGYTTSKVNLAPITSVEHEQIKELLTAKQSLLLELQHYESNFKFNRDMLRDDERTKLINFPEDIGVIPANTRLQIGISTDKDSASSNGNIEITVCTNNTTIIRAVLIFADGLFAGETMIAHPSSGGAQRVVVPIKTPKDLIYDIHIKAFVGYQESVQFHVFELTRQLPKFSMYSIPHELTGSPKTVGYMTELVNIDVKTLDSFVVFKINERIQRICMWINQNFLLPADIETSMNETTNELKINFISLRDGENILISFNDENDLMTKIYTKNIDLIGNLIQSLTEFLKIENLQTEVRLPATTGLIDNLFKKLDGLQETYKNLSIDVTQKISIVKNLIVRAEDARIYDENVMLKHYNELMGVNDDLISNYTIRMENFNEMQRTLKAINEILQKATKLRVGKYSTNMMKLFKDAVKMNNVDAIIKIIETGNS